MARCPQCDSTNTKTLPMIYGAGTSTSKSSSIWITSKGRLGSSARSGSRQSKLAASASPPRAPSVVLGFIGMVLVVVLSWIVINNFIPVTARLMPSAQQAASFQKFAPVSFLIAPILIFFGWVFRHRRKKRNYLPRLAEWEQTWACLKCGTTWLR